MLSKINDVLVFEEFLLKGTCERNNIFYENETGTKFLIYRLCWQRSTIISLCCVLSNKNNLYAKINKYKSSPAMLKSTALTLTKATTMFNEEKYKIKRDDFIIHSLYIRPPSDIDNYPYYLSLLSDKRNFWSILKKSLKERMIFLECYVFSRSLKSEDLISLCILRILG